jgi:predicted RNase H-like nuclease (RuvC/YqgF family)
VGKVLDSFLSRNKKDDSTIGKSLNKNLLAVEEEIIKRQQAITDAQKTIKENAINIKSIADATDISRKTFYNNELLAAFVNENSTVDKASKEELQKVKTKLEDTETKLYKIIEKDIDKEILLHQINKLQQELEISHKRIKSLEKQHEEDLKKMNKPVALSKKYDA